MEAMYYNSSFTLELMLVEKCIVVMLALLHVWNDRKDKFNTEKYEMKTKVHYLIHYQSM